MLPPAGQTDTRGWASSAATYRTEWLTHLADTRGRAGGGQAHGAAEARCGGVGEVGDAERLAVLLAK